MRDEAQKVQADIEKATLRIDQLEAKLEALSSDAIASDRDYLQRSILHLRREKELLLQRLPPAQGAGDAQTLTKYSRNSVAFSKPSELHPVYVLFLFQQRWAWWFAMVFLLPCHFGQRQQQLSSASSYAAFPVYKHKQPADKYASSHDTSVEPRSTHSDFNWQQHQLKSAWCAPVWRALAP